MNALNRMVAIGEAIQHGGHAGLVPIGRILCGTEDARDRAQWPGLAADMARLRESTAVAPPKIQSGTVLVYVMGWEESEAGWGTRPDGHSVHASPEAYQSWLAAYWKRMPPRGPGGRAPEEYERPCWMQLEEVSVPANEELAKAALEGDGTRIYKHSPLDPALRDALHAAARKSGNS